MNTPDGPLHIVFVAGEASGDSHAAAVARELRRLEPGLRLEALGGPRLEEAGVEVWEDFVAHATMGLFPVLKKLPYFTRALKATVVRLAAEPPDLVVPVDYPGFNLRLSRKLRALGIPVCFYVSPQVWAWRPGRIHKIARSVDHMMVLFDFEVSLYEKVGTPVTHVGHPLFDTLSAEVPQGDLTEELGLGPEAPLVGLLPGSRRQEVQGILPELLGAARCLFRDHPGLRFAVPVARPELRPMIEEMVRAAGGGLPLTLLDGRAHEVMQASRVALTASGTATLELAFYGTPMVIVYKVSRFEKACLPLLGIGLIGLVNIIFGSELVLEFLDARDRSGDIAREAALLLAEGARRAEVVAGLQEVRGRVGEPGTAGRAARCILDLARRRRRARESQSDCREGEL